MATRVATLTISDDGMVTVKWTGLLNTDVGAGVAIGRFADKTTQMVGAFGATGDNQMEGSLDGGTTWGRLHDPQGVLMTQTDSANFVIAESPLLIRPNIAVGDGSTNLTCYIAAVVKGP